MKYGSLNLLEPSGPVKACNGIALPLPGTLQVENKITKLSEPIKIHNYKYSKQNLKKYIHIIYYNKNMLIFGWMVSAEGFRNLPSKIKCRGIGCTAKYTDHGLWDGKNLEQAGKYQQKVLTCHSSIKTGHKLQYSEHSVTRLYFEPGIPQYMSSFLT
jgi:hypothetical protein